MRSLISKKNKKGQAETIILTIVTIFIIGIIVFFMNHFNETFYSAMADTFEDNDKLNNTEAHQALETFRDVERSSMWDFAFFIMFIGLMIQMMVFSFASRSNIAFFWIFIIVGVIALMLGVMLSNIWQGIAENPEFATTILRFPITNVLLGSYFPIVVTGFIFIFMIVLFGKFPGQD